MKKAFALVLSCLMFVMAVLSSGCTHEETGLEKRSHYKEFEITGYGLHNANDGTITLNGVPFYGFGVNWHGCVSMSKNSKNADAYWAKLAENGVPYVRMMFGVFYAKEYDLWDKNPEKYLEQMDAAVAYAEKYHIGIVASLMWNYDAIPNHIGQSLDTLTDPESETMDYIRNYLTQVINRFKDSPAIWAWEIGNEASESPNTITYLKNLENGKKSLETWTYEDLSAYYKNIGDIIYSLDPYRMITGGDMSPRHASNSLRDHGGWYPLDTYEDTLESITYLNPGHVSCQSVHYPEIDTWIDWYMEACESINKGFFVGEFHGTLFQNLGDALSAEESAEEANEQSSWNALVDAYIEKNVQMFTTWCYARCEQQIGDNTSLELGVFKDLYQNYYQISRIKQVNEDFVNEGKNKSAEYWDTATYIFGGYFENN